MRSILIGLLVACVVVAGAISAFEWSAYQVVTALPSANTGRTSVMMSLGQSLLIDNVNITLTSVQATPASSTADRGSVTSGPSAWLVKFALRFQNPTAQTQAVSTANWLLVAFGGGQSFLFADGAPISSVAPHATVDEGITVPLAPDGAGPYVVQTDALTVDGATLGWQFNG